MVLEGSVRVATRTVTEVSAMATAEVGTGTWLPGRPQPEGRHDRARLGDMSRVCRGNTCQNNLQEVKKSSAATALCLWGSFSFYHEDTEKGHISCP